MKNKKIIVSLVLMLAVLSACSASKSIMQMTGEELDAILNDSSRKEQYLVIDVRTRGEYEEGHVRHSINIPLNELAQREDLYSAFKNKKSIVVICRSGSRSMAAARTLKTMGYDNVYNAPGVMRFNYRSFTSGGN